MPQSHWGLLPSCKPPITPKITATEIGKSGPGAQTIKDGYVTFTLSAEGKPVSCTIGNGSNLLRLQDVGPGFYMTAGTGPEEKSIPFAAAESKDCKLIITFGIKAAEQLDSTTTNGRTWPTCPPW